MTEPATDLVGLTADIVAAYVSRNRVAAEDVAALVGAVHGALQGIGDGPPIAIEAEAAPMAKADVRRSIRPEGLVSFIDGQTYKTLKRHLGAHGLTPQTYRQRFGLPDDYPMVSPAYSARRSELARSLGLGKTAGGRRRKAG